MAEFTTPAIGLLAPFDGITRIRFKGSVAGATLSAIAAPPQYCFLLRIGLASAKSTCAGSGLIDRRYSATAAQT